MPRQLHPSRGAGESSVIAAPPAVSGAECLSCAETGATVLAGSTVRLAMGDRSGTVDLCDEHLDALRSAIEPVLMASARRARRRPSDTAVPRLRDGEDREEIRRWAHQAGLPVSSVGTISSLVLEQYRAAHAVVLP